MGQVFRARDTRLDRDVAIKILPEAFAQDADRLARFQREARTLASLNHPNIAAIYGLEEGDGMTALVMELVEGEDLSQRIARGAISLDEVLPIAKQIVDGLEAAHEQGIVHRDLKPANIKLRADGTVKVLDFGLAKAPDPTGGSSTNATGSPTITTPAPLTSAGAILGTTAYMSPEQARGKAVDNRSDIWAFGCVLFELLTGTRAFCGEVDNDTMAAIISREPDWTRLPPAVPAAIRRLLRRCLEKDRRRRLSSAADARLDIDDALTPHAANANLETVASRANRRAWLSAVTIGFVVVLTTAIVLLMRAPWRNVTPPPAMRLDVALGAEVSLANSGYGSAVILSPDGTVVVFVARKGASGSRQLYVRRLNQLQATALSGTDGAESPFFSPDGQWIAFFAGGKLKTISVTGGAAVTVCDAPNGRGGGWSEDGTIVLSPNSGSSVSLQRVSSAGGRPEPLTSLAEGEASQRWPQVLPGGEAVLFTSSASPVDFDDANVVVQPLPSGARKVVHHGGYYARYVPSGHLVYVQNGTLFAAPFDLGRLEETGHPVPVLEGVTSNATSGGAEFDVSMTGTLVYLPGQSADAVPLQWMDGEGKTTPLQTRPGAWYNPQFAPDGRRLAINIVDGQNDVWVYEWARDTLTRLTFDAADDRRPLWTPDGRRIVFASARADRATLNLYWRRADGTGDEQRLTESMNQQQPASWHPSGKFLAFEQQGPQTNADLMILPMEGDDASGWTPGKPTVFLNTPFTEHDPTFSPDGRWLAYSSNDTGRQEVYVRPFPGPGGKWQISTEGGAGPTWSRTKQELFYGTLNGQIMVAPFRVEGDSFLTEKPQPWSVGHFAWWGPNRGFDLHPDGERFALAPAARTPEAKPDHLTFVFNFFDELRGVAPAKK
jgi:serine/threonine-protein kinase